VNAELTDYDAIAIERARKLRPELDPTAGPGAARSYQAFVRMLSVAHECNDLRSAGVRNAITAIAERRGMSHSTVTMILHRARNDYGVPIVDPPTVPSLDGVLRIVADWYASSEGRDVLYDELTAAGFQLPDADR
jgi:hypothetical protein